MHLAREAQSFARTGTGAMKGGPAQSTTLDQESEDDFGVLDLEEVFTTSTDEFRGIMDRLSHRITEFAENLNVRAEQVKSVAKKQASQEQRRELKKVLSQAAGDMDDFAFQVAKDTPSLGRHFDQAMQALIRMLTLFAGHQFTSEETKQLNTLLQMATFLVEQMSFALESLNHMRNQAADLPPLASSLIRSKRRLLPALDDLSSQLNQGLRLTLEAQRSLKDLCEIL